MQNFAQLYAAAGGIDKTLFWLTVATLGFMALIPAWLWFVATRFVGGIARTTQEVAKILTLASINGLYEAAATLPWYGKLWYTIKGQLFFGAAWMIICWSAGFNLTLMATILGYVIITPVVLALRLTFTPQYIKDWMKSNRLA